MDKKVKRFFFPERMSEKVFLFGVLYLPFSSYFSENFVNKWFGFVQFLPLFFILYCYLFAANYVGNASLEFLKSAVACRRRPSLSLLYLIAGLSGLVTTGIIGWRAFQSPMWERSRRLFENYQWYDYAFWACGILFIGLYVFLRVRERRINSAN